MPVRRNTQIILKSLLEGISRVKSLPPKANGNTNQQILKEQLEKIEEELNSMGNMFPLGNHWDEIVIEEFDDLEEDVAEENVDGYSPEEMEKKIQRMKGKLKRVKSLLGISAKFKSLSNNSTSKASELKDSVSKDWKRSNDWQRLNIEKSILESSAMTDLQLSYHNLKDHLKLCLLCFSVFPMNSVIKRRPLIYWWIGEGLLTHTNSETAEMVGEDVLKELQKNGMIKPWRKVGAPLVSSYMMHPWIHRMVISVARRAGFFDFDDTGSVTSDSHMSRRVCFLSLNGGWESTDSNPKQVEEQASRVERPASSDSTTARSQTDEVSSRQEARHQADSNSIGGSTTNGGSSRREGAITLFNVNEPYLNIEQNWFSRQKKVRVFQLGRWQNSATHHIELVDTKFLDGLGAQKHLKYLSLRGLSRITDLPESIAKLTTLIILDLRACHNLEKLPSGIKAMKKLTHLDVSECYLLEQMPKGLDTLSHLQVLKGFVIANSRSKDPCRLKDLAKLEKLRKLSIIIGGDANIAEDDLAELVHFQKLQILTITWGATESSARTLGPTKSFKRAATLTMSFLSMPPNLEKLDLRCFPKKYAPTWLRPSVLVNLKRLYIRGGKLDSFFSTGETETWKVEILRLKFLKDLEMEWSDLLKSFPLLVYLEKKKCEKLRSFQCDEHGVWVKK